MKGRCEALSTQAQQPLDSELEPATLAVIGVHLLIQQAFIKYPLLQALCVQRRHVITAGMGSLIPMLNNLFL
jgi:hypothetical protein